MSLESLSAGRYTGGRLVAAALKSAGITHCFGIPGTHNIELYDALESSPGLTPVLVTDEQSAGFMADGMSRSGGPVGCANVVPGAGITHLLSGVAEAWMDNVPMLVLCCGIRNDTGHRFQLHDIDQLALLEPVCKATMRADRGEEIPAMILRAVGLAKAGCPGPVAVEIPGNHYLQRHRWDPRQLRSIQSEIQADHARGRAPDPEDIEAALRILLDSEQPHFHLGLGAAHAVDLLTPLVERVGAVVTTTFSGKGVFAESHPQWIWPGLGRTLPSRLRSIVSDCDSAFIIGARMGEVSTGSYGLTLPEASVHVDIDPQVPGANFPVALPVVADSRQFIARLSEALLASEERRGANPALLGRIDAAHSWVARRQHQKSEGVSPAALFEAIQRHFPASTRYTTDSGRGTFLAAEHLRLDEPRRLLAPVDFSCMGYAIPAAIGAAMASPESPVVALPGDGAFLMTGLELLTAVQCRCRMAVFVLRDRELGQIARFQRDITNRLSCTQLPDFDLGALAAAVGANCIQLSSEIELDSAMSRAREASERGTPIIVDVAIDYSQRSFFERGVIRTNFGRLPWQDRLRMVARTGWRRVVA
jgi:acetolactate synthase-1/2/3 large subunit